MEDIDPNELLDSIRDQIEKLVDISSEHEMELTHVKPHGALYNLAVNNEEISPNVFNYTLKKYSQSIRTIIKKKYY